MTDRSFKHSGRLWSGVAAIALSAMMMAGPTAQGATLRRGASGGSAQSAGQDTFLSGYFDFGSGSTLDNALRIENPTAVNGNLCAMIYVFDAGEEMGECCGCLLTPNQMRYGTVKQLIGTQQWIGIPPVRGVIQIVSATPNSLGQCVATQNYIPTPTLNGWITHAQTVSTITGLTEVSFTDDGDADPTESITLISRCAAMVGNGSGAGHCTCPTSDE
jgi:hypothetical protein